MQRILKWAQQSSEVDYATYKEMKAIYEQTIKGKQ